MAKVEANAMLLIGIGVLVAALVWRFKTPEAANYSMARPVPIMARLSQNDVLTIHQAFEGCLVLGAPGSGKTSSIGSEIPLNGLYQGMGALWLCAKVDEAARAISLCHQAGREKDIIHLRQGGPHKIDWLAFETSRPGGSPESAAQVMDALMEVGNRTQTQSQEMFFQAAAHRWFRNAVTIILPAKGSCSLSDVRRFVTSMPTSAEEANLLTEEGKAWARSSFCGQCLIELAGKSTTPDLDSAVEFVLLEIPVMAEKTRSSVLATLMNPIDRLTTGPVGEVLSSGTTTFTPFNMATRGKIVIADFPIMLYQEAGQLLAVTLKALTYRSLLGRDLTKMPLPVMVVQDEGHFFCQPRLDSIAQSVSRQSRLINVVCTQNLPMLITAMGGPHAMDEVRGWVGLFQTLFVCQNSCAQTNAFFSSLLGEHKELLCGGGSDSEPFDFIGDFMGISSPKTNVNYREEYRPMVPPEAFTRLKKGGAPDFTVEAFVYQGGRQFSNGLPFLKTFFRQRI